MGGKMNAVLWATDADETAILTLVLQRTGFTVRHVRRAEEVLFTWQEKPTEFAILAPRDEPILKVVTQIRAIAEAPLVIILGLVSEDEVIELLEAGADQVVERPYSARKLIAQVKALLRRASGMRVLSLPALTLNTVSLDPANRMAQVLDRPAVRLTQLEFRLLYTLMIHAGQIIPTETLAEHVWGYANQGDRDLVRGLIKRLRIKIELDPHAPRMILNEPGIGYRFEAV